MVSERYDSGDRNLAGDVINPENVQETDLDTFFESFGPEFSPLEMCKKVVQENVIHSFKPTSTKEIYEKWGKRVCEFCDEQLKEIELAGHDCSHKAFSVLYLHEGMKDELMVIVYHKTIEEEEKEHIQDLKNKAEYSTAMENEKELSRSGMYMILQKDRKKKKNRIKERKKKNSNKKREREKRSNKKKEKITIEKNNKKKKIRKKKKGWSNPREAGGGENRGAIEFGIQGERENLSYVSCGSGGGPGKRWLIGEMGGIRKIVGFFWVAGGCSTIFFGIFEQQLNVREEEMRRREKQEGRGGWAAGDLRRLAGEYLAGDNCRVAGERGRSVKEILHLGFFEFEREK